MELLGYLVSDAFGKHENLDFRRQLQRKSRFWPLGGGNIEPKLLQNRSWRRLGASWALLAPLGAFLEPLSSLLAAAWRPLCASWGLLGPLRASGGVPDRKKQGPAGSPPLELPPYRSDVASPINPSRDLIASGFIAWRNQCNSKPGQARFPSPEVSFAPPARSPSALPLIYRIAK